MEQCGIVRAPRENYCTTNTRLWTSDLIYRTSFDSYPLRLYSSNVSVGYSFALFLHISHAITALIYCLKKGRNCVCPRRDVGASGLHSSVRPECGRATSEKLTLEETGCSQIKDRIRNCGCKNDRGNNLRFFFSKLSLIPV